MTRDITAPAAGTGETLVFEGGDWFDPLEEAVRGKARSFIEAIIEEELEASLSRKRYERHRDGQAPTIVRSAARSIAALPSGTVLRDRPLKRVEADLSPFVGQR